MKLEGHAGGITTIGWVHNSKQLISGGKDGMLRLWDVATGRQLAEADSETRDLSVILRVAWSPNGKRVALAGKNGTIQVWDSSSWMPQLTLDGHHGPVNDIAWSPDGDLLVSGGEDGTVRVWDTKARRELFRLDDPSAATRTMPVKTVAWSPKGDLVVTGRELLREGNLQVWNVHERRLIWEKGRSTARVMWSPDGERLAALGSFQYLEVYSVSNGDLLNTQSQFTANINDLSWSPDGKEILFGSGFGATALVYLWKPVTDELTKVDLSLPEVTSVTWSLAQAKWAVGTVNGAIEIWDVDKGQIAQALTGHNDNINCLAWSPDGIQLISASEDGTVRVWGNPNP
jgi:WD40 repeat protein